MTIKEKRIRYKAAHKQILEKEPTRIDENGDVVISMHVENEDQIYSNFDWDNTQELNTEFSDYIWGKAKNAPRFANFHINIYTTGQINELDLQQAIHKKFQGDCVQSHHDKHTNRKFSLIMLLVGLITLTLLFLNYFLFPNRYSETILEIVSWVFIWEAVDAFFLENSRIRRRENLQLRLYLSEVKVIHISKEMMNTYLKKATVRQIQEEAQINAKVKKKTSGK